MRIRMIATTFVVFSLLSSSSVLAQQRHIVDPAAMQQAIADQSLTDQQNRDAVLDVLHQPQVLAVAGRLGLNVTWAEGALATLSSAELARAAVPARVVDAQLAGGANTIVISTTTLLLIIIIVILVAN